MEPPKSTNFRAFNRKFSTQKKGEGSGSSGADNTPGILRGSVLFAQRDSVKQETSGVFEISNNISSKAVSDGGAAPPKSGALKDMTNLVEQEDWSANGVSSGMGRPQAGGGSNVRKLLEDLHQSRILLERDQHEYENARQEIDVLKSKIAQLELDSVSLEQKKEELMEASATKKTQLRFAEIKNKIADESLKKHQKELNTILTELQTTREKSGDLSSFYLSESLRFAMMWNGASLGQENRSKHKSEEIRNLELEKQQLESEMDDFLCMLKGVSECEMANECLEKNYKEYDAQQSEVEAKLQEQINTLTAKMRTLEDEESQLVREMEAEYEKLGLEIQEKGKSVEGLQNKNKEVKTTVKSQSFLGNSSSEEDYMLAAAAAEVSQDLRSYEPITPAPSYRQSFPPPSKVRVVERQVPITSFMKQLSTAKVIAKPKNPKNVANSSTQAKASDVPSVPSTSSSAAAPSPSTSTTTVRISSGSGKTFQFKKKSTSGA